MSARNYFIGAFVCVVLASVVVGAQTFAPAKSGVPKVVDKPSVTAPVPAPVASPSALSKPGTGLAPPAPQPSLRTTPAQGTAR